MNKLFRRKLPIAAFFASLLIVIFGCSNLYAKEKVTPPVSQKQLSLSTVSQKNQNNIIAQQPQNTPNPSEPYPVIDEFQKPKYQVTGNQVFSTGRLPGVKIDVQPKELLTVLVNTRKYFQDYGTEDPSTQRAGILATQGVTVENVLSTLDFMIEVLQEDIANNRPIRLQDPKFINQNFRVIKWSAYNPQRPKQRQVRMTKYAVFTHPASKTKTAKFNTALYSLKDEFTGDKFFTKYTKQDVLAGIYEPGGKEYGKVEPLAYLTREGLEDSLMQGTVLLNFTDGTKGFFNVDRNNEIAFVRGKNPWSQERYWYFRQVDAIKGYGYKIDAKISIEPGVTYAGDVLNIGLGRIVALEYNRGGKKNVQMGIIADTGGAFLPNLYQLDFLSGIFNTQQEFKRYISQLPEFVTTYILVKK